LLSAGDATPTVTHGPLSLHTPGVGVVRGEGGRALTEPRRAFLGPAYRDGVLLRSQEGGAIRDCLLYQRFHNIREHGSSLLVGGFRQLALRLIFGLVSLGLVVQFGGCRHPVLSLRVRLRDPLDNPVALRTQDGHGSVRDQVGDGLTGAFGGVFQASVCAVSGERIDELLLRVCEIASDDVQPIRLAPACHANVDACRIERVGKQRVCGVRGRALDAVRGGRVGQVRVLGHVIRGQSHGALSLTAVAGLDDAQRTVVADVLHRPGLPVGNAECGLVAAGLDHVPGADGQPVAAEHRPPVVNLVAADALGPDAFVQRLGLVIRSHGDRIRQAHRSGNVLLHVVVGVVQDDQPTLVQPIENRGGVAGMP